MNGVLVASGPLNAPFVSQVQHTVKIKEENNALKLANQKASSDLAKEKKKGQILEAEVETPASAGTALVSRDCCE